MYIANMITNNESVLCVCAHTELSRPDINQKIVSFITILVIVKHLQII